MGGMGRKEKIISSVLPVLPFLPVLPVPPQEFV